MKEIKFRAWRPTEKIMLTDNFDIFTGMANNNHLAEVDGRPMMIPMQFTGLKDKNGREICEGDIPAEEETVMSDLGEDKPDYIEKRIVHNFEYADGRIGERRYGRKVFQVEWRSESCGFEPFSDSKENCGHCGGPKRPKRCEIIGNLYENPELLSPDPNSK